MSLIEPLQALPSGDEPLPPQYELLDLGSTSISVDDLLEFKSDEDPSALLGARRWLCRGGACLWVGSTGVGKSTIITQAAMLWGLGRDFFGVVSKRPLKSLIIQAENDLGDIAEMFQGISSSLNLADDDIQLLRDNFQVEVVDDKFGEEFASYLSAIIEKYNPDMVWIDPLLSFAGSDISKQEEASRFLRQLLTPIIKKTGIIIHLIHHTGKPSKDKNRQSVDDLLYAGLGSSEIMNWVRAGITITREADYFRLTFTKRGERAGALNPNGMQTTMLELDHSRTGHAWVQLTSGETMSRRLMTEEKPRNQKKLTPEICSTIFSKSQTRHLGRQVILSKDNFLSAVQIQFDYPHLDSPKKLTLAAAKSGMIHQIDVPRLQHKQGRSWVSLQPFPDDFESQMLAEWEQANNTATHDKKGDKE